MTQLMISFPFNYQGLMMVSAMAKHILSFLLSRDVFYHVFFLYVLCFTWLQDKFPLGDNEVEIEYGGMMT